MSTKLTATIESSWLPSSVAIVCLPLPWTSSHTGRHLRCEVVFWYHRNLLPCCIPCYGSLWVQKQQLKHHTFKKKKFLCPKELRIYLFINRCCRSRIFQAKNKISPYLIFVDDNHFCMLYTFAFTNEQFMFITFMARANNKNIPIYGTTMRNA